MVVTIDLDGMDGRLRDAWVTLPSGATLSADTARLTCDAEIIPVVLGGPSSPDNAVYHPRRHSRPRNAT